ncbi:MAG: sulfatase [Akkermansiaceae bacterium]|nr:sulfatase [Akkermansiaceae bacterium]
MPLAAAWLLLPAAAEEKPPAAGAPRKPNVVFILADDLGVKDLSVEGSTYYETPHIDRIAKEGMRFTHGYATCQVCSPSRASILTGTYPARHGITDWIGAQTGLAWKRNDRVLPPEYRPHLPHADTTLAEALKAAGYRTFFAGKWHLGDEGSFPEDHGFEINIGGHHRGSPPGGFFAPFKNPKMKDGPRGESLPIRLANDTAQFIRDNRDRPFLAYLSFYSVHGPIQTTEALWNKYRRKAAQDPHDGPRFKIDRTLPVRQVQDCPIYAGMMESMDDAVGIVLGTLDDLGLAGNTVVIFTSDNGGVSSGDAFATCNLPYRGGKGRQWEGGIREPYYIKAPGVAKPGGTSAIPVTGTDFFPTILDLAGLDLLPKQHRDGVSLVPVLKGGGIPDRPLFWHYPHYGNQGGEPSAIIRRGDWKLIFYFEDRRVELYNLIEDPGEQSDLAARHPDRVESMRRELQLWLKNTGAKIPRPDDRFDPEKHKRQEIDIRTKRLPRLEKQHARFLDPGFVPNKTWWDSQPAD